VDNQGIQITDEHVNILRWEATTKQFDKVGYIKPESMNNIKTRVLLNPNFNWTGNIIIDMRHFELAKGTLAGTAMFKVGIPDVNCKIIMLEVYLTKKMFDELKEPLLEVEATIKGFK